MSFVGRDVELARLQIEFAAAASGAPRVAIVEGPPGIGKTTLIGRFVATLEPVRVLRSSGDEAEVDLAYGVIDQLLSQAGARRSTPPEGHIDAGSRLLDVLSELQADGPVIVLVDDAHWADEPSLKALTFAVRRLVDDAVLVLLAVREDEVAALPSGLLRVADGLAGSRVALDSLTAGEVRELAEQLGITLSAGGARRLREHGGGRPLYTRALLEEVRPQAWEQSTATLPAPRSFAALIGGRVAALPAPATALLEAASVLGVRSGLAAAARVGGIEDPFAAVEAPLAAQLIALDEGPEVRFAHPLIRAAIYQQLSPSRRARLHASAAAVVDDEGAALRHRVAAATGPDAALADELAAFAERCARAGRWDGTTWSLVAASQASVGTADRERRLLDGIEAAMYAGDSPRARALASRTQGFAGGPKLDSVLAYVAVGAGERDEAERRLNRAWKQCEHDPQLAARIAERLAFLSLIRLRASETVAWARRARALLADDDPQRGRTTWSLALGLHYLGEDAEAHAVIERSLRYGNAIQPMLGGLLLSEDDLDGARRELADDALRSGSLVVAARSLSRRTRLDYLTGLWDDAVVHADRGLAIATEADEDAAHAPAGHAAVLVAAARGDFAVCEQVLRDLAALPAVFESHLADIALANAVVAAAQGHHADVLEALDPLVTMTPRDAIDDPRDWPWPQLHAAALVGLGRLEEAEAFLDERERMATARGARLMLAWLARERGNLEAARDAFEDADLAFARALDVLPDGMPYERALIEFARGRALRRAGRRKAAATALGAATETFTALAALPLSERATRELEACGLTPVKRGPGVDRTQLTPQERSVARLAAGGLSNRDVAVELLLSVRTVERHLTNVYRKLGVHSRTALDRPTP